MDIQNMTFKDWVVLYNQLPNEKRAKIVHLSKLHPEWNFVEMFNEIDKAEEMNEMNEELELYKVINETY